MLLNQQPRDAATKIVELRIGPAAMIVDDRKSVERPAVHQLSGRVQPFGILKSGKIEAEFRKQFRRRQAVFYERIVLHFPSRPRKRGSPERKQEAHSSTTAVVSISILAALSTRPLTSTSAIAG